MEARLYHPKRCTTTTSSSVAEAVADIDDLLTEILVRVPAISLLRFKCVSKHWLFLISDTKFCHRHTLQNPDPSISGVYGRHFCYLPLILDHVRTSSRSFQSLSDPAGSTNNFKRFSFGEYLPDVLIDMSCNGLFLCSSSIDDDGKLYVLNPTTKQFSMLVIPPDAAVQPCRLLGYALAFDPSRSPYYKVLVLQKGIDDSYDHIHVYSSETRSWRLLNSCFTRIAFVNYDRAVYCNGTVNWAGDDNELSYYHIDEERVGHIINPQTPVLKWESRRGRYFQESHCGRYLHLVDLYRYHLTRSIEVLEMGSDYSGWILKYQVDLDPALTGFTVLFMFSEEDVQGEESSSLLLHYSGNLSSYNFKSNMFESFDLTSSPGVDDSNGRRRVYDRGHRYMATLACV